jgi:hypothetical protein
VGGNYKGAAQQGGQAAMDDWKKTGAGTNPGTGGTGGDAAAVKGDDAATDDGAAAGGNVDEGADEGAGEE